MEIWINPACSKCRSAMSMLDEAGAEYTVRRNLDDPPTSSELDAVLREHGMGLVLDLVPNHTSELHPWFLRSRSSRTDPYRDYYIWRDPAPDGGPPNNWVSVFGGPAWTYDERTSQYYLHLFTPAQPDLNWDDPRVAAEFDHILRFWLDRGVAGFRVDVAHRLVKAPGLPDQPTIPPERRQAPLGGRSMEYFALEHIYDQDQPGLLDIHRRWQQVVAPYDALLLGEVYLLDPDALARYLKDQDGLHLSFWFALVESGWEPNRLGDLLRAADIAGPYLAWVQSNHDRSRAVTRYGGGATGRRRALTVATMTMGLPALPMIYQGEELGLEDGHVPPEAMQDPLAHLTGCAVSRDPARTPMPWAPDRALGFTTAERAWLPWGARAPADTVAVQDADSQSCLSAYRRLLATRRRLRSLRSGELRWIDDVPSLLGYERGDVRVACNIGTQPADLGLRDWVVEFRTDAPAVRSPTVRTLRLQPEHAVILRRVA
jgi:alpha-glucosidase